MSKIEELKKILDKSLDAWKKSVEVYHIANCVWDKANVDYRKAYDAYQAEKGKEDE